MGEGRHLYELVYLQKDQNWKNEDKIANTNAENNNYFLMRRRPCFNTDSQL
jgi:hypothetical protein